MRKKFTQNQMKQMEKLQKEVDIPKIRKKKRRKWKISRDKKHPKVDKKIGDITRKKVLRFIMLAVFGVLFLLLVRIGYIQFGKGVEYAGMAIDQQSMKRKISPKRGTIYDATGKEVLAVSSSVEMVTVNPTNIAKENKEKVARALSEILEVDYEKVAKRVGKHSSIETIAKKVEKDKTNRLREWMRRKWHYDWN